MTIKQLSELLDTQSQNNGIISIKPRLLFRAIELKYQSQPIPLSLTIPSSSIGSITTLEAAQIVSLLHLTQPKRILEFGTFLGYTTRLLLENSLRDSRVTTVDLPNSTDFDTSVMNASEAQLHSSDSLNDKFLTWQRSLHGAYYLRNLPSEAKSRLHEITADSRTLSLEDFPNSRDDTYCFAFIDGGHDEPTVKSDTALASSVIAENGVLVWHDFNSQIHHDVTSVVNALSESGRVYSVENTLLAFQFIGEDFLMTLAHSTEKLEGQRQ